LFFQCWRKEARSLRKLEARPAGSESTVDVVISTSYSFPNLGKILTLGFVLFAGWFSDTAVPISKYPTFAATGLFSFFGDPTVAIPFLLDLLRIPSDTFRFFLVVDNLVGSRFGTLLAAMYTLVLAVLGACAVSGLTKIRWPGLLRYGAMSVVLTLCTIGATRFLFEHVIPHHYRESEVFGQMDLSRQQTPATIHKSTLPQPPSHDSRQSRLPEIRERGYLRIGYFEDSLPFAFENQKGKLVGFDVEMAYLLAQDMKMKLEFVRVDRAQPAAMLNGGYVDMIMSGIAVTLERAQEMTLSTPYTNATLGFITKDHRREDFGSRENLKKLKKLKLGVPNAPYYMEHIRRDFLRRRWCCSIRREFSTETDDLDALAYSAEGGSAWTLMYPAYTVAVPQPDVLAVPLAYGMARGDRELADFVNTWIDLKMKDRTIAALYDHWILGRSESTREPRWSVIRNVLHLMN
jgi:ABC-type amino acid transport substrate-binding protein